MLHYIRDLQFPRRPSADYDGNLMISSYVLFHFLRVMGWQWLWECDTQDDAPNHCPDGDMEEADASSWLALGTGPAVLTKDPATKHQGYNALEVDSQGNADDGARSSALTSMENTTEYRVSLWASNNTGSAWNVDVDTGSGSFTNIGTIPDNGGTWTLYHFTFTTAASGTRYIRVVDNNATGGDLYLDDINIYRSWFEYNVDQSGSDGDVQNGDEFSSAGYTFVSGDIGKALVFYDPSNLGNSGAYLVDSVNAGNAVLTLRMGGSEQLINTSVGTLVWRLLDLTAAPCTNYTTEGGTDSESGAGWGLESPHTSKWRLFFRHRALTGNVDKPIKTWSSPIEADFSSMDGHILEYEPSTLRPRGALYDWTNIGTTNGWYMVGHGGTTVSTHGRLYAMVASGGEIVAMGHRSIPESTQNAMGFFGITGSDSLHTDRESFVHLAKRNGALSNANEMGYGSGFSIDGACGTDENIMPPAAFGFWHTDEVTFNDSDNKANPFSGDEFLQRPLVLRDYDGTYGHYSEKECDVEDAIWACRTNLDEFTPFGPVEGTNSAFSLSGSTITLTANESIFTADMVGKEITIAGATTGGNDGTFIITSRISATQVTYENAGGATEAGAGTCEVGAYYFHFENGVCWKWPGFTAVA